MTQRQATAYERFQWFRHHRNPDDPGLTVGYVYALSGDIRVDRLNDALRETLSTAFPRLLSYFTEVGESLRVRSRSVPQRVLHRCERKDALLDSDGIDPTGQTLYRFRYWQESPEFLLLRLDFSHLVFDGSSYAPFCAALGAHWRGETPVLERAAAGVAPRSEPAEDEAFWRARLAGRGLHQPLPFRSPSAGRDGRPLTVKETLSGERAEVIHRFLRDHEVSLLQFVAAVTGALVHACADGSGTRGTAGDDRGERRVVVAHTVDTRPYGAPYGCHTNLLPLWLDVSDDRPALSLLDQVRTQREELRDHQAFPTLDLLAAAGASPAADRGGSALNLVVNHSSAMLPTAVPDLRGVEVSWVRKPDTGSSSDVAVNFSSDEHGIHLSFDSSTRLMAPETLSALATNFSRLARFMAAEPELPPARCDLSRPTAPVAEGARGPARDPRGLGAALVEALGEAHRREPGRVAVADDHGQLTHGELLDATHRLCRALAPHGGRTVDGPDAPGGPGPAPGPGGSNGSVGVFLGRSAAIPVACLTALVLGRTFVPLDPALPDGRLTAMASAAELDTVLVDAGTRERARRLFPHVPVREVDARPPGPASAGPGGQGAQGTPDAPDAPVRAGAGADTVQRAGAWASLSAWASVPPDPGRTAYVMFTSGSTGVPKGVAVSEGSLVNFLESVREDPGPGPEDVVPALTPIGFDISLLEILLPLLCGARLHVLPEEARFSGALLAERLAGSGATVVQATPSTWRILRAAGWRANRPMTLLCGGEHLDRELAEYLLGQGAALYNMYGPTEATVWASWQRVTDARRVHLGVPAHNTRYYVVDAEGRSVAPGMSGELVIAGDCVAQGYLNAPSTPFRALPDGTRGYWTGDLVRREGPSHLVYVSRADGWRKVNGYRIDPGEVAAAVRALAPASATVFAVVGTEPEPHLRCFVWLPEDVDFDTAAAYERCRDVLPYYMVPKAVHRLREIPLTANGKADVKRLAEAPPASLGLYPQAPDAPGARDVPPASADRHDRRGPGAAEPAGLLAELRRLVADELGLPVPDADQPLGYQGVTSLGHNILAARISDRYGIVVRAHDFYRLNTLRNVARTVARLTSNPSAEADGGTRPAAVVRHRPAGERDDDRLALVGLSSVLPGGPDPEAFWEALVAGRDSVGPAAPERGLPGEVAGFLPGVRGFDARFFSVSPLEASWTDPRQRLMLQSAWHTLEDAGLASSELRGSRTGCYIAATGADYALLQARADARQMPYSLVGHSLSLIAHRISSWFDWHGPSMTLDTACSGSLVALVRACRDLRAGVCDTALVGGVNLILDPQINEGLRAARFLSPDHRCAAFDASANGYVRGEGYGTFLVKRLPDALADDDTVLAVVESVAENHGGRANSLTAPNPDAQRRLLLDAYTPDLAARVGYIETHGTGTVLGDAIEIDALKRAWDRLLPGPARGRGRVRLGAVKSHIGHLEPAAGVASVTKVTKAFEHRTLPANLHFSRLSPAIELDGTPFEVLEKTVPWDSDDGTPLVAGISSFGFGGSNAHVVLSSPPNRPAGPRSRAGAYARLVPLSARTPAALRRLAADLADHVERTGRCSDEFLLDLSYTLCRREHFEYRHAWVVSACGELPAVLRSAGEPVRVAPAEHPPGTPSTAPSTPGAALRLYLAGGPLDWRELFAGHEPRRLRLAAYPFDEADLWFTDGGRRP